MIISPFTRGSQPKRDDVVRLNLEGTSQFSMILFKIKNENEDYPNSSNDEPQNLNDSMDRSVVDDQHEDTRQSYESLARGQSMVSIIKRNNQMRLLVSTLLI